MKLKIFECQNKFTRIFRSLVCIIGLVLAIAIICIDAITALSQGFVRELINSVGLMLY